MRSALSLVPKVTLTFVLFAAALLFGVGVLAYSNGRRSLENATFSDLLSTAIEKEATLETWIAQGQSQIVNIAESPFMRDQVVSLLRESDPVTRQLIHDQIVTELAVMTGTGDFFVELALLESDSGRVVVATDPDEEGTFKENRPYFIHGQNEAYVQNVYFSVGCQCPAMAASAPLQSDTGQTLVVVVGKLNLADMGTIINRVSGLHETTDAYLVNTSSLLVTQPRLLSNTAVLQFANRTETVRQCLNGTSGMIHDDDHRNVPVLAVYRWLPDRNLCLVVNIDREEAFAAVQAFGRSLLITAGIALLGASLVAVGLARTITRPILALKDSVTRFGQGEEQVRFPQISGDELGALSHAFNTMADAIVEKETLLQNHARDLEARVNERTSQLTFLANASRVLSESFDYSESLTQMAQLAVPQIADWCAVDMLNDDGSLQRLAVVHTDPKKVELAYDIQRRYPPDPNALRGSYKVLRTGQSEFYPDIPDELLVASATDAGMLSILRELGLKSSITVPLLARGRALGTLILVMAESGRQYTARDLELGEDLARRAALLIDNARLYEETKQLNIELEQRVQERTAHLQAVNGELEAFSYSVSHDLRAPLRALDGFSQAIVEDYHELLDEDGKEYLDLIRFESQRMGQLIDDLIDLSRFTRTELHREQVDLSRMGQEITSHLQIQHPQRDVEWIIQNEMTVCADAHLIRIALQNLLGNAWKYTGQQTKARIEFGTLEEEDESVYFVRDNGAGFDMAFVDKLFGAFQRLHAATEYEGTGIGLATVQRIIHRHGGQIRAEGAVNEGATFYFNLGNVNCD